jgi:hypothetical protein
MLKAISFLSIVFFSLITSGQSKIKEWDKAWDNSVRGKLKKIQVGNLSDGFAVFYFKSDKSIFSVEKRALYKTGGRSDSASSFSANFRNDTLFRVVIRSIVLHGKEGKAIIYLDDNKIVGQEIDGKVYIPEMSKIIETARQLLLRAKELTMTR